MWRQSTIEPVQETPVPEEGWRFFVLCPILGGLLLGLLIGAGFFL